MNTILFKTKQRDFNNVLSYFNKIKEITENYNFYIKEYKKYTNEYHLNLKKLYTEYSPKLKGGHNYFEEEDTEIITNKTNLDDNINNIRSQSESVIDHSSTPSKNFDLSPIFKFTNKIFQIFDNQLQNLDLFINKINFSIDVLEKDLNETNNEIEKIRSKYLDCKQNYVQLYSDFEKKNKIILENFSTIEKKLIKYYIQKYNENIWASIENNDNDNENEVNLTILNEKKNENDFLKDIDKNKNSNIKFKNESNECIKLIEEKTLFLMNEFKSNVANFISELNTINFKGIENQLNKITKISNEINYNNLVKLMKISTDEDDKDLEDYVPSKYNINILADKNFNNINGNTNKNLEITEEEKYKVVKKMYNFILVNQNDYNLKNEGDKIRVTKLVNKLIIYTNKKSRKYQNHSEITEAELKELIDLLNDKNCRLKFLLKINYLRTNGIFEIPPLVFFGLSKIFNALSEKILINEDIDNMKLMVILSQTFYNLENNKKIYLIDKIKDNKLFQSTKIWNKLLEKEINLAIETAEKNDKKIGIYNKENAEKKGDLVFTQLIPWIAAMTDYGLSLNLLQNIVLPFIERYNVEENKKNIILNLINNKGNV